MQGLGSIAIRLALVLALALGLALAQGERSTLSFSKADEEGDGVWEGMVSGDVDGDLRTVLLAADQEQPVWIVSFEATVDAGEMSLVAHVAGTLDTTTGEVRMTGVVTEGHLLGASIDWRGQMTDPDTSRFEGEIVLTTPSR